MTFSKHKLDHVTHWKVASNARLGPVFSLLVSHLSPLLSLTLVLWASVRALGALQPPIWEPFCLILLPPCTPHPLPSEPLFILQLRCHSPGLLVGLCNSTLENHSHFPLENLSPCIIHTFKYGFLSNVYLSSPTVKFLRARTRFCS